MTSTCKRNWLNEVAQFKTACVELAFAHIYWRVIVSVCMRMYIKWMVRVEVLYAVGLFFIVYLMF